MAEIKLKQKDYEAIIKNMDNELIVAKSIIRDLLKLNNDKFGQTKMDWRISVVENAEAFLKDKCPYTKEECCIYGTVQQCKKCDKE